jgi:hypothetical protein
MKAIVMARAIELTGDELKIVVLDGTKRHRESRA